MSCTHHCFPTKHELELALGVVHAARSETRTAPSRTGSYQGVGAMAYDHQM